MAGHNKWTQIKYKKAASDAKRGKLFSKLARVITLTSKELGPDPKTNIRLASTIEEARSVNMPNENIERAIKKATERQANDLKEVLYEAYGPGGSALIITAVTDSSNRTTNEIRHLLSEHGARLGEQGSAMWAFEKNGKDFSAKFPIDLDTEALQVMDVLLNELDDYEDVQDVFTNIKDSE